MPIYLSLNDYQSVSNGSRTSSNQSNMLTKTLTNKGQFATHLRTQSNANLILEVRRIKFVQQMTRLRSLWSTPKQITLRDGILGHLCIFNASFDLRKIFNSKNPVKLIALLTLNSKLVSWWINRFYPFGESNCEEH